MASLVQGAVEARVERGVLHVNGVALLAHVGAGAWGEVLLGRDTRAPGQPLVAVKAFSKSRLLRQRELRGGGGGGGVPALARVLAEVAVMTALAAGGGHACVAALRAVLSGADSDELYLVMDYVDCGPPVRLCDARPGDAAHVRRVRKVLAAAAATRGGGGSAGGRGGDGHHGDGGGGDGDRGGAGRGTDGGFALGGGIDIARRPPPSEDRGGCGGGDAALYHGDDDGGGEAPLSVFVSRLQPAGAAAAPSAAPHPAPVPLPVARQITRDVLRALSHAHARRVAHRDVKPDNVLLASDGTARLCDWGSATLFDDADVDDREQHKEAGPEGVGAVGAGSCAGHVSGANRTGGPPSEGGGDQEAAARPPSDGASGENRMGGPPWDGAAPRRRPLDWVTDTAGTLAFLPPEACGMEGDDNAVAGMGAGLGHDGLPVLAPCSSLGEPPDADSGGYSAFAADAWAVGVCLHVLLFGVLPFGRTARGAWELLQAVARQPLAPLPFALAADPPACAADAHLASLLGGLLAKDAGARLSVDAALAHPWLAGGDADAAATRVRFAPLDTATLPPYRTPAMAVEEALEEAGMAVRGGVVAREVGGGLPSSPPPAIVAVRVARNAQPGATVCGSSELAAPDGSGAAASATHGWLWKRGRRLGLWTRRWFELVARRDDDDGAGDRAGGGSGVELRCAPSSSHGGAWKRMQLAAATAQASGAPLPLVALGSWGADVVLALAGGERLVLRAPTAEDAERWAGAVARAAAGVCSARY